MARYVSIDEIDKIYRKLGCSENEIEIAHMIEDLPTVDAVEVVHGEWEYGKWENGHWIKGSERCRCTACHRVFPVDPLNCWWWCPQCGAKMDGINE